MLLELTITDFKNSMSNSIQFNCCEYTSLIHRYINNIKQIILCLEKQNTIAWPRIKLKIHP